MVFLPVHQWRWRRVGRDSPRRSRGFGCPTSMGSLLFLLLRCPCPASPLTAHLLTAITPPSSSLPSDCLPLYLPLLLHLLSLANSLSPSPHTHTHTDTLHPPSSFSVLPSLSSLLHFSGEAAPDSLMSPACQKLLLTFQFKGFFLSLLSADAL